MHSPGHFEHCLWPFLSQWWSNMLSDCCICFVQVFLVPHKCFHSRGNSTLCLSSRLVPQIDLLDAIFPTIEHHSWSNHDPICFLILDSSLYESYICLTSLSYDAVTLVRVWASIWICSQIECSPDGWRYFHLLTTIPDPIMTQYAFWFLILICTSHIYAWQVSPTMP
jgi:hypothetical protein